MPDLRQLFKHYTGALRGWKAAYIIHNILNAPRLLQNRALYHRYGVHKSVFDTLGKEDFKSESPHIPWLDRPDAREKLVADSQFHHFPLSWQKELLRFVDEGYMILRGFYDAEVVEKLNREIQLLLGEKKVDFNFTGRKIMDAFRRSELADKEFFRNPDMLNLLNFIMGRKVLPFQTINFLHGSEQKAHSDSFHMTTEPQGYLIATWTALEEVHSQNGPLFYYPGSHRLKFVSARDFQSGNTRWKLGHERNKRYEDKIQEVISENKLKPIEFHAQPGDVLIWHANLLHGGSPILKAGTTRKSMVAHYFCEGVICYHEITQRPAILDPSNRQPE
jgi:ectoine hydroxylase